MVTFFELLASGVSQSYLKDFFSVTMKNTVTKKQLRKERFIFFSLTFPANGPSLKKSRQELKHMSQRGAAYWLVPHGLLSHVLTALRPNSSGMALPTVRWALTQQSSVKKMHHGLAHTSQSLGTFSQWKFSLLK